MTTQPLKSDLFIAGNARPAGDGATFAIHNPARPGERVGLAAKATAADVDDAMQAAHAATAGWAALSYDERAAFLLDIRAHLAADEATMMEQARLFTREHGKVLQETLLELSRLGDRFAITAGLAARMAADEAIAGPPFDTLVTRRPFGVTLIIVPWNWPLSILGATLPQALLAGNTVVVKPPETATLVPTRILHQITSLLPPGVLNVVTGDPGEIGETLVAHPLVRKINFTGSIAAGRRIMTLAARSLVPVTLELGGNDAAIVLEDAKLDKEAFQRMYLGAFLTSGQICMALKRLYVHRSRYDEVVEGLSAVCARQRVGDGLLPDTTMGPLNNRALLDRVVGMIEEARAADAEVRELGSVDDEELYRTGFFQKPTLVLDAKEELQVVAQEQFGPVLPIMRFDNEAEALRRANDTPYGLFSSVWTEDRDRAVAVARKLEAGYTYINNHGPLGQDSRAPFGGFKQSGIGRNLGFDGVREFTGSQSISAASGWLSL